MSRAARGRVVVGLVGLGLAASYLVWTLIRLPLGQRAEPGAAVFPLVAGVLLALASVALLAEARRESPPHQGADATRMSPSDRRRWRVTAASLVAYPLLLPHLGYLPTTLLVCLVVLRGLAHDRWGWDRVGLAAAALTILVWGLFVGVLGVPLPTGPFGRP